MGPDDLSLIRSDAEHVAGAAEVFSTMFYNTLFDIAPSVRAMFPDDMSAQRRKLFDELDSLVHSATEIGRGDTDRFTHRARSLGERHMTYSVTNAHYAFVGTALLAALAYTVPDWSERHERSWLTLYRLVADTMRDGASRSTSVADGGSAGQI